MSQDCRRQLPASIGISPDSTPRCILQASGSTPALFRVPEVGRLAIAITLPVNPAAAKYCWLLLAVAPRLVDRWSGRQVA
jgi:hypothetical protein